MKSLLAVLSLASTFAAGTALAQPMPFNDAGVTMGHWHLNSRDVEANKKIFVAMGGTAETRGGRTSVRFPGIVVNLNLPGRPPATEGSVGSVINHVGLLVPNVQEAMAKWKAAGVPVTPGRNNRTDQAFVTTADGLRVEILEDKDQKIPVRHHHVHFFVQESAIPEIQAWYGKHFGAKASMRGNNKSVDVPGANLTFGKTDKPLAPTKGRVLDHIGFDVKDLKAFIKTLEADGITLDRPYTKNEETGTALAFIHDPWGTSIELNERPPKK